MSLLLSLVLSASPSACGEVFPNVWNAWLAREKISEERPRFAKVPDAKDRVEQAWLKACEPLDAAALDCAKGLTIQKELDALAERSRTSRVPKEETDLAINLRRKGWSALQCPSVDVAMKKSVDAVVPPPPRPENKRQPAGDDRGPRPRPKKTGPVVD